MFETVYSDPKHFGLDFVALLDTGEPYEFDMFLVLRDPRTGEYLWATDSGCSCPEPFEGVGVDDMSRGDAQTCVGDVAAWMQEKYSAEARAMVMESQWMNDMLKENP